MNETFKEIKERLRRLEEILWHRGGLQNADFAQALSRVHRLVRKGDRSREPSVEIRASLDRAETLGRAVR